MSLYPLEKYLFYFIQSKKGTFKRVHISPIVLEVRGFAIRGHVFPPTNRELAGLPVCTHIYVHMTLVIISDIVSAQM